MCCAVLLLLFVGLEFKARKSLIPCEFGQNGVIKVMDMVLFCMLFLWVNKMNFAFYVLLTLNNTNGVQQIGKKLVILHIMSVLKERFIVIIIAFIASPYFYF